MHFQLLKVILWSRNSQLEPRVVHFEPHMVNVVMGLSRTGKSALIPIIDYCLGAGTCAVPKKVIRAACSWFGVVIETSEGQKLFARREPGEQDATEDMFVMEAREVEIPRCIVDANETARNAKRRLDELSSLSHLDFAGGEVIDSLDHRPSFRDLMAFVFQPQNVVANPDVLFYRTDQLKHRVKLARNILPYVLGAVSPEILAAQHEIERLERILRRKQRDLEAARVASSRWESEIAGHLSRAAELGLIEPDSDLDISPNAMLELLRKVAKKTVDDFRTDSSTITRSVEELAALEQQEASLGDELAVMKSRQSELSRLREGAGGYHDALLRQGERLAITDWLITQHGKGCPICGGALAGEAVKLETLQRHLKEIESTASKMEALPVAVDREVHQIRLGSDEIAEKLANVRRQKKALTGNSEEAQKRQFQTLGVAHFLGQLQQAIFLYDETHDGGELASEISELEKQIEVQKALVDEGAIRKRKDAAVARIGAYIAQFMPQLDNDHPNDAAHLVIEDLTLRINTADGESYLWGVGSGSNHLSYHVATLLALHRVFLDGGSSSVPGLLILDQPSQVYFPEEVRRRKGEQEDPKWNDDEDCRAVRKIFELLGKVVSQCNGRLQVIVLDHAPSEVWGELHAVTLTEDWRNTGRKLVPATWPGAQP